MCGRYTLTTRGDVLAEAFSIIDPDETLLEFAPRFNVAPTQRMPVVRADPSGQRRAELMRWGLVPPGAPDLRVGARMINARSETAHRLPAFRRAYRARRCIVPADGWYEWTTRDKVKDPWRFVRPDRQPFGMAGLWEEWTGPDGVVVPTFTVLTMDAAPWAASIHDRMPVLLSEAHYTQWLDPKVTDAETVGQLVMPWGGEAMRVEPVSHAVNKVANDGPQCLAPRAVQGSLFD